MGGLASGVPTPPAIWSRHAGDYGIHADFDARENRRTGSATLSILPTLKAHPYRSVMEPPLPPTRWKCDVLSEVDGSSQLDTLTTRMPGENASQAKCCA